MALTTDFVAAVYRQGSIPSNTLTLAEVLAFGDREIQSRFIPLCEATRQNYFVRETTASADFRGRIPIPSRAISAALRNVQLALGNGWSNLPNRALENDDWNFTGPMPLGYYVDAGSIVLLPTGSSGTCRIRYLARPGRMVDNTSLANCARITSVSVGATVTTLTLSGAYAGSTVIDIVSQGPAHQQKVIGATLTALTVPNTSVLEAIEVGDYVTVADTSPFVPLPEELMASLVHRTAGVILRALGYNEEAAQQLTLSDDAIQAAKTMLQPRNEGNPQRVTGGLRSSLFGRGRGRFRGWGW